MTETVHAIIGTAGHIDHGKTALVRALTGCDTDRLKEEKERGITIELGFAHLDAGGRRFGLVDVPGHERFLKTMVAGAGGVDIVMLVIAADEGVMPQTREHLDVCQLLGLKRGVVPTYDRWSRPMDEGRLEDTLCDAAMDYRRPMPGKIARRERAPHRQHDGPGRGGRKRSAMGKTV